MIEGYVQVNVKDKIGYITMTRHDNRLTIEMISSLIHGFDELLKNDQVKCIITTGQDRFYSNGISLLDDTLTPDYLQRSSALLFELLKKILYCPVVTLAMINGHAFGAGFVMALAHDYRVMNEEKGWVCIPAAQLGIDLPPLILHIIKCVVMCGLMLLDIKWIYL
eukprot:TRINITY_DN10242_c0_g1_i1.p1 TRINITY_DN10242_c0_g1~~TRINITY_DN10242_c0_g1_i1.p1  ORF type:complete len:165 (+),score=24.71 TRINITY_DN10242_c0_g1_i1:3-497(+)